MAFKDFASGLFGGLGSVISGAIGAKTTANTNKTNLKINQMNNDFKAREAQKAVPDAEAYLAGYSGACGSCVRHARKPPAKAARGGSGAARDAGWL